MLSQLILNLEMLNIAKCDAIFSRTRVLPHDTKLLISKIPISSFQIAQLFHLHQPINVLTTGAHIFPSL
jgi:hypothetical protein